jgi:choline dehydrogenase-like flavoprotein
MGIPKPETHYSIADYTRRGHERSQQDFRRIAELMGGSNLRFSKEGSYANNQHICGTLSMGNDPNSSVCDQWGRAHEHDNLYLAGTGVLPTCGTCNSTENGLAVALRTTHRILAEHKVGRMPASSRLG